MTWSWHKARENFSEQIAIGFGFRSDCLRKWLGFFKPTTKRSSAKPKNKSLETGIVRTEGWARLS